jgi:hypothetical protein
MVHGSASPFQELFQDEDDTSLIETGAGRNLLRKLGHLSSLYGKMSWTPEAGARMSQWNRDRLPPVPTHSKLEHYCHSRLMFGIKLATISAISRSARYVIEEEDVKRGLGWLFEVEKIMPDVFREMLGKSDKQIIDELHHAMVMIYGKDRKPVSTAFIWKFLSDRAPSDKLEKIMLVAERSGAIAHPGGVPDLWVPKSRSPGAPE